MCKGSPLIFPIVRKSLPLRSESLLAPNLSCLHPRLASTSFLSTESRCKAFAVQGVVCSRLPCFAFVGSASPDKKQINFVPNSHLVCEKCAVEIKRKCFEFR
jgi:hypothetical protein